MTRRNRVKCSQCFLCVALALLSVPAVLADEIKASRHDTSLPLSRMVIGGSSNGGASNSQSPTARATGAMITNPNPDPVAAPLSGPPTGATGFIHFDGKAAPDNRTLLSFAIVPQ